MKIGFMMIGRLLSLVLVGQGHPRTAKNINLALDLWDANVNVDSKMRAIADKAKAGVLDDWDEIEADLQSAKSEFLSRGPDCKQE